MNDDFTLIPHDLVSRMNRLNESELNVATFLCRHTFGSGKLWVRMTIDEFQHGPKRSDGIRIGRGTGQSPQTIRKAVNSLITKGLVAILLDESDGGVIKTWYTVHTNDDEDYREYPDDFPNHLKYEGYLA